MFSTYQKKNKNKKNNVDRIETILGSCGEVKGWVHSPSSENKPWIRFTCLKNYRLLDFITRNEDLFYELSLVSHLPLRYYKTLSSKWKNKDGYLFMISFVCIEHFRGYPCSKGYNSGLSQWNLSKHSRGYPCSKGYNSGLSQSEISRNKHHCAIHYLRTKYKKK